MSITTQCAGIHSGESVLIECDSVKQANNVSTRMNTTARLPKELLGRSFTCAIYTGIALKDGSIIYINKVTRLK